MVRMKIKFSFIVLWVNGWVKRVFFGEKWVEMGVFRVKWVGKSVKLPPSRGHKSPNTQCYGGWRVARTTFL
jgi:hypothetical protein